MEKLEWNLQEIFSDQESFYREIHNVKQLLEDIQKYENLKIDATLLLTLLDKKWEIKEKSNYILIYGSLMYYKNVNNDEYIELKKVAELFHSDVDVALKWIDRKIIALGIEKISSFMLENPKLEIYKLSFHNLFRLEEHIQTSSVNQKIKENNDHIQEQLRIYNNLLRDIEYGSIYVDGKDVEITSSNFTKYISSRDRETRKQTYEIVAGSFQKEVDTFAHILNEIYCYRTENSKLEKYSSVLEKVLFEENIDPEIIHQLIKSVNHHLNLMQKYLKMKSDFLEIKEPHLYDFGVPFDCNLKIKYSLEEAKGIILKALEPLGNEYLEIVKLLFHGHIDAELNENKHQSITFSWHTYSFMNFRGAYIDLKNMVHEIGHIVNYYLSKKMQPFIYEDSTIFVGETASIVNEILLNRYLYKNAKSEEEKIFYLSKDIENYVTSVFKQTMYTEFENDLYEKRTQCELTSEFLSETYGNILKKYYGKGVCYDDLSNNEWTRLGHLYRWNYYPYKYATGLLIASVVVDALVDQKTLKKEDYMKFLSAGSSQYSLNLLKTLQIDLTNSSIIESGFHVMSADIEQLQKILSLNKK